MSGSKFQIVDAADPQKLRVLMIVDDQTEASAIARELLERGLMISIRPQPVEASSDGPVPTAVYRW